MNCVICNKNFEQLDENDAMFTVNNEYGELFGLVHQSCLTWAEVENE